MDDSQPATAAPAGSFDSGTARREPDSGATSDAGADPANVGRREPAADGSGSTGGPDLAAALASTVDPARILADAHELAFPRYPGTEGDRRAIALVAGRFAAAGLAVSVEEFSYDLATAWRALRTTLVLAAGAIAASGLLVARSRLAAAGLLAAGLVPAGIFLAWSPWLERLYRRPGATRTANVEGRRPALGPRRRTLVLLAHHDSKSQNLGLPQRVGLSLMALAGTAGVAVALFRPPPPEALSIDDPALSPLGVACGFLAAIALLLLTTLRNGNLSPGGIDNAGSVAIVCELARTLPARVPPDVELIFLSPGAEEDHMVGAMRWLDRHAAELATAPVDALNLDGAGNPGRLALIVRYGFGRPFAPALATAARETAATLGIPVRRVYLPPALGLDSIPFVHRGIPCLTLASGALDRATLAIHSAGDTAANLSLPTLHQAAHLTAALALTLTRV